MWINMNNKPKQRKPFRIDRSKLMNVPTDYDHGEERANNHPNLLQKPPNLTTKQFTTPNICRSVLGGPTGTYNVDPILDPVPISTPLKLLT